MELFTKLFGSWLVFIYHCFGRIVIQGYLPLLTRPEHIVHFFRDVQGIYPITKPVLAKRTREYQQWVEAFARNHHIPIQWPQKGVKNEDYVRPYCLAMERRKRYGVYHSLPADGPTARTRPTPREIYIQGDRTPEPGHSVEADLSPLHLSPLSTVPRRASPS